MCIGFRGKPYDAGLWGTSMQEVISSPKTALVGAFVFAALSAFGWATNLWAGFVFTVLAVAVAGIGLGEWNQQRKGKPKADLTSPSIRVSATTVGPNSPAFAANRDNRIDKFEQHIHNPSPPNLEAAPRVDIIDASQKDTPSDGNMWRVVVRNSGDTDDLSARACINEPDWWPIPWRPANKGVEMKRVKRDTSDICDIAREFPYVLAFFSSDPEKPPKPLEKDLEFFNADGGTFPYHARTGGMPWPVEMKFQVCNTNGVIWDGALTLDYTSAGKPIATPLKDSASDWVVS